jgi:hypothetical protein
MAHADMPEGVEHALMAENAVGDGKLVACFGEWIGHGGSSDWRRGRKEKRKDAVCAST